MFQPVRYYYGEGNLPNPNRNLSIRACLLSNNIATDLDHSDLENLSPQTAQFRLPDIFLPSRFMNSFAGTSKGRFRFVSIAIQENIPQNIRRRRLIAPGQITA